MRSLLIAIAVLLVTAPPAGAKVWFQDIGGRAVRRDAPEQKRVGRISGSGTLRFRVPRIRTGRYRLVAGEDGRLVNASAAFTIRP